MVSDDDKDLSNQNLSIEHGSLPSDLDISLAIISCFFNGNLTQSAFITVSELITCLTDLKIPRTFDKCINTVLELNKEKIRSDLAFYCVNCKFFASNSSGYQRKCVQCKNRSVFT